MTSATRKLMELLIQIPNKTKSYFSEISLKKKSIFPIVALFILFL